MKGRLGATNLPPAPHSLCLPSKVTRSFNSIFVFFRVSAAFEGSCWGIGFPCTGPGHSPKTLVDAGGSPWGYRFTDKPHGVTRVYRPKAALLAAVMGALGQENRDPRSQALTWVGLFHR